MMTLGVLAVLGVIVTVVVSVVLLLIGLPLVLLFGLLPWLLRIIGVVLLLKALFDKPVRWENFMPAIIAFVLSGAIHWIF